MEFRGNRGSSQDFHGTSFFRISFINKTKSYDHSHFIKKTYHTYSKKQNLTYAWMQEDKHEKLFYSYQSAIQDNNLHLFGLSFFFAIFCRFQ